MKLNLKQTITSAVLIATAFVPLYLMVKGVYGVYMTNFAPAPSADIASEFCIGSKGDEVVEASGFEPKHIVINGAGVNLPVLPVGLENGTWKVNEGVANFAKETSLISSVKGNVGIYAHDRINGFMAIKDLKAGDTIEIYGDGLVATYEVTEADITPPEAVDVFYPTEDPMVTLVTCDGDFSEKRYIIRAKLVSINKSICDENTI